MCRYLVAVCYCKWTAANVTTQTMWSIILRNKHLYTTSIIQNNTERYYKNKQSE